MTETAARITETVEWQALQSHFAQVEGVHLRELFARDPRRGEAMTLEAADLYLEMGAPPCLIEVARNW